ncbi:DNA-nicking endonuclease, Smr domain [Nitrosomonas sp. Nm51]|uniref:Smr/MutS family protein n=1 Tax=Nitrosomonas sp. Nm51 TaxID=133720 RepID=UPI0008AC46FC|nr:Smr/MutS family protein [Nitrosomonas sp. Nm51]SER00203.1 DNA-nicking endonuclease, Smr domain [Nitrosomonas sp. Nm51]
MSKKEDTAKTNNDDMALFHEAMKIVAPLAASDKTVLEPEKPVPLPRQINPYNLDGPLSETVSAADQHILALDAGDEWSFSRPGVSRQTLRRLRRGVWRIRSRLDLHGLTQDAAKRHMTDFLNDALHKQYRCIQIIHGKGLSSQDRIPVLKKNIGSWLAQHHAVLAFCQASPEHGGGGALMVLLKGKGHTR